MEHRTASNTDSIEINQKQKGMHIFGELDSTNVQDIIKCNIEWITFVPFGDQKNVDSPTMNYYKDDALEMMRRDSAWKSQIEIAHQAGLKVFLKPHVWLYEATDGKWRSDIFPTSEDNWQLWQQNYTEFILLYAQLAEETNVELFCIGTEFTRLSTEKPLFWRDLIKKTKRVYSGQLTYAANWYEEFEEITFWDDLDFIGIQAYFPLVDHDHPTVQEISKGWKKYIPKIKSVHQQFNKPILFTEMGYKSTTDSAKEPWKWLDYSGNTNHILSLETQANCYQAFFDTIWEKDWLAGVHFWQWRSDHVHGQGRSDLDFTPRGKPAEGVIREGFE